jgi:hypothetical protein
MTVTFLSYDAPNAYPGAAATPAPLLLMPRSVVATRLGGVEMLEPQRGAATGGTPEARGGLHLT